MVKPELTQKIAYEAIQGFFSNKIFVLFGTGTSCALDKNFGVPALQAHLSVNIPPQLITDDLKKEWRLVESGLMRSNVDFEAAMDVIKHPNLIKIIIKETYKYVYSVDKENSIQLLKNISTWSALPLFKRLVEALPPADPLLHVATPNYDMIAEYAFSNAGIPYTTGFSGGVIRKLDWTQACRALTYSDRIPAARNSFKAITRIKKHIRLYKVHGSLNTFHVNGCLVESDLWGEYHHDFIKPMIITPGLSKHRILHDYRDDFLREYDKAVKLHNAFLFLGFGFNDTQLVQNMIAPKLKIQSAPALIITMDLNEKIETLAKESINCWIICKQEDNNYTRIFNAKFRDWLCLDNKQLWNFNEFTTEILGG